MIKKLGGSKGFLIDGMEFLMNAEADTARFQEVQKAEEEKAARVAAMQEMMREREKATEDFIAMIDQQLEKMEANVDPITGTIPKQLKMDLEAMGEKLLNNSSVKPAEDIITVKSELVKPRTLEAS